MAAGQGQGQGASPGEATAADMLAAGMPYQQQQVYQLHRLLSPFPSGETAGTAAAAGEGDKGAASRRRGGQDQGRRTDLDRPLVLTGAMEMLATALVSLPAGDVQGAMQCVG